MAVPTTMQNLSLTAASNSPAGTDAIGNSLDDYLRALSSILRSTYSVASSSIASAATVDVASANGESVAITGTTTISSLGTGYAGCIRELRFSAALTITNSSLLWLGGSDFVTKAGDALTFRCTAASTWQLVAGSRVGLSGIDITGTSTYNSIELGFRSVPQTVQNGNYTFVLDDNGKCRLKNTSSAYTYTVPASVFSAGHVLTVFNGNASGNITLAPGAGLTALWLVGNTTTGNRTVAPGGLATIYFTGPTTAVVSGGGVT